MAWLCSCPSKQPDIPEQQRDDAKEPNPHAPPHPRLLGHPHHSPPRALQPHPRIVKLIVDALRQTARAADLVANGDGHGFELGDFGREDRQLVVGLGLE